MKETLTIISHTHQLFYANNPDLFLFLLLPFLALLAGFLSAAENDKRVVTLTNCYSLFRIHGDPVLVVFRYHQCFF